MTSYAETIGDQIEINSLSMLADKRATLQRISAQQAAGLQQIAAGPSQMLTAASNNSPMAPDSTDTSTLGGGSGALVNRSPTTIYNLHPQPATVQPTPASTVTPPSPATGSSLWPWLLAIPLMLGLGGLAWYLWPKTPADPNKPPPGYTVEPSLKFTNPP